VKKIKTVRRPNTNVIDYLGAEYQIQDFLCAQKGRYRITPSHTGRSVHVAKAKHAPKTVQPKSNNKTTYA